MNGKETTTKRWGIKRWTITCTGSCWWRRYDVTIRYVLAIPPHFLSAIFLSLAFISLCQITASQTCSRFYIKMLGTPFTFDKLSDNSCVGPTRVHTIECVYFFTHVRDCVALQHKIIHLYSSSYDYERIVIQKAICPRSSSLFHVHPASNGITLFSLTRPLKRHVIQ